MLLFYVISGLGETATSAANGLNALASELRDLYPTATVRRWAWGDEIKSTFIQDMHMLKPQWAFVIGHSFGGSKAVEIVNQYRDAFTGGPPNIHMVLFDPVRMGFGQLLALPLKPDPVVVASVDCYTRSVRWYPPRSSRIVELVPTFVNHAMPLGHNEIPMDGGVHEATLAKITLLVPPV